MATWNRTGHFFLAVLLTLVACAGCSRRGGPSSEDSNPGGDPAASDSKSGDMERLKVGMLPKLVGIPYFEECRKGAQEAARELNVELEYRGPLTADSVRQAEIVKSWISRGFDVVAAAPNNPEAIAPVLQRALESGVRVVTWDTDANPEAREYFCNQVGYDAMAETLVDIVAEQTDGQGRVALISGTETAANQNTWMGIMRRYAAENYPGLKLLDPPEYPGEDDKRSFQSALGLLNRPEPPDAMIGMTTVSAPAAARAVSEKGLSGDVVVTGITLPSTMREFVKNGTVKKFVLWDPVDFGYLTVYAARRLADGELEGDELDAGRLGKLKVENGEIVLGPPLVFDASNIDKYQF